LWIKRQIVYLLCTNIKALKGSEAAPEPVHPEFVVANDDVLPCRKHSSSRRSIIKQ
jgi:hypothetical protein